MPVPQVLLIAGNPLDIRREDVEGLLEELARTHGVTTAYSGRPQRGSGVTWWEVVLIYVAKKGADAVTGRAFELLLDDITDRCKLWYRERRAATGNSRPLSLGVLDEDGHVVRALEFKPNDDVEDVTAREQERPPRPRPQPGEEGG